MNRLSSYISKSGTALIGAVALGLVACGGGGGGGSTSTPTTPVGGGGSGTSGPTWTQGVFENETNFKDRCETPRSGINPATNAPYADVAGSTLFENHWLRSWSNNTYLWYSEIVDRNPAGFSDTLSYFDVLKTDATTQSGTPRDQFHFTYDTAEYQELVSSGSSASYGVEWTLLERSAPRDIRVAFTEPGSPGRTAGLTRGLELLQVDGVDAVNDSSQAGVDVLNAALFPSAAGETHDFVFRTLSGGTLNVTMTSAIVTTRPVNETRTFSSGGRTFGYMHFTTFGTTSAEDELINAMQGFSNAGVQDLVLDLRYNGGGFLAISSQLGYMIAGSNRTRNRTYETLVFNDKHPTFNPVTGERLEPTPFYNTSLGFSVNEGQALPTLNLGRVFVLVGDGTCSASESLINSLIGINVEVIMVGSKTCGKPYGFYATDNCGITYFTIQFRGENDVGFGDYADGFTPANAASAIGETVTGCAVADDFSRPLGSTNEGLLATALEYANSGTCPAPTAQAPIVTKVSRDPATAIGESPDIIVRGLLGDGRITDLP